MDKRKPNFSVAELSRLVAGVAEHNDVLSSKFSSSVTQSSKRGAWLHIASRVNAVSEVQRSAEELKKKWSNYASSVKGKEAQRRRESRKTGGGPPPKSLSELEDQVINLIGETAVAGVVGGIDTSESPEPSNCESQALAMAPQEGTFHTNICEDNIDTVALPGLIAAAPASPVKRSRAQRSGGHCLTSRDDFEQQYLIMKKRKLELAELHLKEVKESNRLQNELIQEIKEQNKLIRDILQEKILPFSLSPVIELSTGNTN